MTIPAGPLQVGILGTMVWDRIDHPDGARVERWGGISYSLAAAAAALPDGWTIRPIIKIGDDLAEPARSFLRGIPGLESLRGVSEVPHENNRVELRYRDRHDRDEILSGGVPGWSWQELEPRLYGLDALYVNLISGFELDSPVASRLRTALPGPVYADLHSLVLGVATSGTRVPRPVPDRDVWLDAFDMVQVNEQELALLAAPDDPVRVARDAIRSRGGAILVTRGPAGSEWFAPSDRAQPWAAEAGEVRSGVVPAAASLGTGDPTGCGDVWGATCFISLLRGDRLSEAMAAANRAAGRNMNHRGAEGLYDHLRKQT